MLGSAFGAFQRIDPSVTQSWKSWAGLVAAVILIGAGGLIFDAMTPQIVSVGFFYVAVVFLGFWFPDAKAALVLALLATPAIVMGYWIAMPDATPEWEAWLNRALAIGVLWMAAAFVWYIRVLDKKLETQIEITETLAREIDHRVGNQLQLVASFLRLQARASPNEQLCCMLELAASRVTAIGSIQRMLSHSMPSRMVDAKEFITAIIDDVQSALPDPEKIDIVVQADAVQLISTRAVPLGALLVELINNALKHAFPNGMKGNVTVGFTISNDSYVIEFKDDGVGSNRQHGFGTQNVTDFARLMGGTITCQPAHQSAVRPGTLWRLVIPA